LKENEEKVTDDGQRYVEINDDEETEGSDGKTKSLSRKDSCGTLTTPTPKRLFSPKSKGPKISEVSGEKEQKVTKKRKKAKKHIDGENKTEVEEEKQTTPLDPSYSPPQCSWAIWPHPGGPKARFTEHGNFGIDGEIEVRAPQVCC